MGNSGARGIRRLINAFGYSLAGFRSAFRHEEAFRQEVVLCLVLAPIAVLLERTLLEKAILLASLLIVLIVELLNSAVEAAIDRVSSDRHPLSGRAKDLGSAAVFVSLANVLIVWALIALAPLLV